MLTDGLHLSLKNLAKTNSQRKFVIQHQAQKVKLIIIQTIYQKQKQIC